MEYVSAGTTEHVFIKEEVVVDDAVSEEVILGDDLFPETPFDIECNPFNEMITDSVDNSGLYYAYQEDVTTDSVTEQDHDAQTLNTISSDHSYTSSKSDGEEEKPARNETNSNNLEVSEIVIVKSENGLDKIQEITLLVKKDENNDTDLTNSNQYQVLAKNETAQEVKSEPSTMSRESTGLSSVLSSLHYENGVPTVSHSDLSLDDLNTLIRYQSTTSTSKARVRPYSVESNDFLIPPYAIDNITEGRPPYSYSQLIVQALACSRNRIQTLNGIYSFIVQHYSFYRQSSEKGWKNSIRHNLSLNPHFIHIPRAPVPNDVPRKGGYWRLDPMYEERLIEEAFSKRKKGFDNKRFLKYVGYNKRKMSKSPVCEYQQADDTMC